MTKINEFFSSGLCLSEGGSSRSAKTLHPVTSDLPTTLGNPSWSHQNMTVRGEDGVLGEVISYFHRDPMSCIQHLLRQGVYGSNMVVSPVTKFDVGGEQCYSELHTANWWWEMPVSRPPTIRPLSLTINRQPSLSEQLWCWSSVHWISPTSQISWVIKRHG